MKLVPAAFILFASLLMSCAQSPPQSESPSQVAVVHPSELTPEQTESLFSTDTSNNTNTVEISPLPDWDEEQSVCDNTIPSFNYEILIQCIQKYIDSKEYNKAYALFHYAPGQKDEQTLLNQKITIVQALSSVQGSKTDHDLVLQQNHYSTLSNTISKRTELATIDTVQIIKEWEGLIHKLNRKVFMKATYTSIMSLIHSMGSEAPKAKLKKQITTIVATVKQRDSKAVQAILHSIQSDLSIKKDFSGAQEKLTLLFNNYSHIEKGNQFSQLQKLIEHEEANAQVENNEQNNDSLLVLAKSALSKGAYLKARTELLKLPSSQYGEIQSKLLKQIGEKFCTEKRVLASQDLKQSFSHRGTSTEISLLKNALHHLDACVNHFPDNSMKETIERNKTILQEKIEKSE